MTSHLQVTSGGQASGKSVEMSSKRTNHEGPVPEKFEMSLLKLTVSRETGRSQFGSDYQNGDSISESVDIDYNVVQDSAKDQKMAEALPHIAALLPLTVAEGAVAQQHHMRVGKALGVWVAQGKETQSAKEVIIRRIPNRTKDDQVNKVHLHSATAHIWQNGQDWPNTVNVATPGAIIEEQGGIALAEMRDLRPGRGLVGLDRANEMAQRPPSASSIANLASQTNTTATLAGNDLSPISGQVITPVVEALEKASNIESSLQTAAANAGVKASKVSGTLTVSLSPQELGQVTVKIAQRGGQVEIILSATSDASAAHLKKDKTAITDLVASISKSATVVTIQTAQESNPTNQRGNPGQNTSGEPHGQEFRQPGEGKPESRGKINHGRDLTDSPDPAVNLATDELKI